MCVCMCVFVFIGDNFHELVLSFHVTRFSDRYFFVCAFYFCLELVPGKLFIHTHLYTRLNMCLHNVLSLTILRGLVCPSPMSSCCGDDSLWARCLTSRGENPRDSLVTWGGFSLQRTARPMSAPIKGLHSALLSSLRRHSRLPFPCSRHGELNVFTSDTHKWVSP